MHRATSGSARSRETSSGSASPCSSWAACSNAARSRICSRSSRCSPTVARWAVRTGCMPDFAMSLGDVGAVLRASARRGARAARLAGGARHGLPYRREDAGARQARRRLEGFDADAPPWRTLPPSLLDRTRIAARIGEASSSLSGAGHRDLAVHEFPARPAPRQGRAVPRLLDRMRRLVAIGDDRDLRQLPAAAQGLDAVRLMTIHGAKGLEFPASIFPASTSDTLPRHAKAPPCPPPEGMIAGVTAT